MDFTIGRTLGSREFASSKVKSFIMNFAGRRPGDRLQRSRSSVYFILDERGHLRRLGVVGQFELKGSTYHWERGRPRSQLTTDLIVLLDRGRALLEVALGHVVTLARAHL